MADKFTEFAGRMGKAPKGVGTGLKLLAAAAAVAYGVKESIYTGTLVFLVWSFYRLNSFLHDARLARYFISHRLLFSHARAINKGGDRLLQSFYVLNINCSLDSRYLKTLKILSVYNLVMKKARKQQSHGTCTCTLYMIHQNHNYSNESGWVLSYFFLHRSFL